MLVIALLPHGWRSDTRVVASSRPFGVRLAASECVFTLQAQFFVRKADQAGWKSRQLGTRVQTSCLFMGEEPKHSCQVYQEIFDCRDCRQQLRLQKASQGTRWRRWMGNGGRGEDRPVSQAAAVGVGESTPDVLLHFQSLLVCLNAAAAFPFHLHRSSVVASKKIKKTLLVNPDACPKKELCLQTV